MDDEATGLDHGFIGVAVDTPEDARRAAFGFTEAAPKRRQGQGTPCPRVLLGNAVLELLRVDRPAGARPGAVRIDSDAEERAVSERVAGIARGRVVAKIA